MFTHIPNYSYHMKYVQSTKSLGIARHIQPFFEVDTKFSKKTLQMRIRCVEFDYLKIDGIAIRTTGQILVPCVIYFFISEYSLCLHQVACRCVSNGCLIYASEK